MSRVWIGIDLGAVSYIVDDQSPLVRNLPQAPRGADGVYEMARAVRDFLQGLIDWDVMVTVAVEAVRSRPGQSGVAAFTRGIYYGGILGVVTACHIPYTLVRPNTWKAKVLLPDERKLGKSGGIRAIRRLYPDLCGGNLTAVAADSACIAWYAKHFIG